MSVFSRRLRDFAAAEIGQPGEHKYAEIAERFLEAEAQLADMHLRGLAVQQVSALVKDLCDESDGEQLPLFSGFPVAVAVAPGVVKATQHCTMDDIYVGFENRRENYRRAGERLRQYEESLQAFGALRARDDETVGEVAQRLRGQVPVPEPAQ